MQLEQMVDGLTAHHRLHGVANRVSVETLDGRWETVRELTPLVERAVEANAATPCPASTTTLLYCAAAHADTAGDDEARRLEAQADAHRMEPFGWRYQPANIRLALVRNDVRELKRLVALEPRFGSGVVDGPAALLDALLRLGDDNRIESEAPQWVKPGTYVEPFALRALGVARDDPELIQQALARFEAMGLDWHAAETRDLSRNRAENGARKEER